MIQRLLAVVLACLCASCQTSPHARQSSNTGPWNLPELERAPKVLWGTQSNNVQQLFYEGEPLKQNPTHVFAYLARPKSFAAQPQTKYPGVVLVHGGGGKAFKEWAEHWADRGYVAIAMDLSGNGPNGRLPDGAPDQSDQTKFRNFSAADVTEIWSYHAVADVIRAHSLLATLPEVDASRVCVTGISWGGYLTCIVAGLDHRFKAAVPVYGCGYLGDNSFWKDGALAGMTPESRALWLKNFDPSQYLAATECPILFLNGTHDFAYPLDSYQKSYRLVRPALRHTSVIMKLPHGHIWTFPEVDEFIDRALAKKPFPKIDALGKANLQDGQFHVRAHATEPLQTVNLIYTTDTGPWQKREWTTLPATISGKTIDAQLPTTTPIVYMFTATTRDNLRISSEYAVR